MTDTQILRPAAVAAPDTFVLGDGMEFVLKAVRAEFIDQGALVDWLPACVITSDSGNVVAQAVDQNVKVKRGDDAEVSFFRGVKHAAAAAPPPVAAGGEFLYLAGVQSVVQTSVSGVAFNVQFEISSSYSYNPHPEVYSLNTVSPGVCDTVTFLKEGLYLASGGFGFRRSTVYNKQGQLVLQNYGFPAPQGIPIWDLNAANEIDGAATDMLRVSAAQAGTATAQVSGIQGSGFNVIIGSGFLHIVRLNATAP